MDSPITQLRPNFLHLRRGLAWLQPFPRLVIVVLATTLPFLGPPTWALSGSTFLTGLVLLLLSPRFVSIFHRPVLRWILLAPLLTAVMLVLGNTLFSPPCDEDGAVFGLLRINICGFDLGIRTGLRFGGVNAVGIAWLLSSRLPEFYNALAPLPLLGQWALPFTRHLQFSLREYGVIAQSLVVRGLRIRGLRRALAHDPMGTLRKNGVAFLSLLRSLMNRFLRRTSLFAYATDSHQPVSPIWGIGAPAIEAISLRIKPASTAPEVIQDAKFTVPHGEFVLVAGRDAAGKSTLLRALAGVIPCVQGAIDGTLRLYGTATKGFLIADFGRLVAYFSQDVGVHVLGLTVGQELRLAAFSEQAMNDAVDAMGLADLLDRQTTMLSGGETVRLVLASVLARRTPLLVMDDPFDQLDQGGRTSLVNALGALREKAPITIVAAEKNAAALRDLVTSVLVVEEGGVRTIPQDDHRWDDPSWLSELGLAGWHLPAVCPASSSGSEAVAGLKELAVELGDEIVVEGVTLDLHRGEVVFVRGPNGSGKTTAMLGLVGALNANIVGGRRWSADGVTFGYVFQDTALQFATATAMGELLLTRLARADGMQAVDEAAIREEVASWVGVAEDEDPCDLHPSRQKLLAFAAMSLGADVVVVDEPTIGAGAWAVERLLERLLVLRAQGRCVVLISHEARLLPVADRVLVFSKGRLVDTVSTRDGESRGLNV